MKLTKKGACRGNGRVYLHLQINSNIEITEIWVDTFSNDKKSIPNRVYKLSVSSEIYSFLLVAPLLPIESLKVKVITKDNRLREHILDNSFSMNRIKWESRLNYRLRKDYCDYLKKVDDDSFYEQIGVDLIDIIEDTSRFVIRGLFRLPYLENSNLSFSCFDAHSEPHSYSLSVNHDSVFPSTVDKTFQFRHLHFSLITEKPLKMFGVSMKDDNNPHLNNFEFFELPRLLDVLNLTNERKGNVSSFKSYSNWLKKHQVVQGDLNLQTSLSKKYTTTFSIIVPLFNTPANFYHDMISSVQRQSYPKWELILVNASPDNKTLNNLIEDSILQDSRIRQVRLRDNFGIARNTSEGIKQSSGDFICFLDHDDFLEPDALFEYARSIGENPEIDLLYCDEDHYDDKTSEFCYPFFKPPFSPDLLTAHNYITHFLAVRESLVKKFDYADSRFDGAQDYALTLYASDKARHVEHVPRILYHWRMCENSTALDPNSKPYAEEAGRFALQQYLDSQEYPAQAITTESHFLYRVIHRIEPQPQVSIIIPSKDNIDLLSACIDSIIDKSTYKNYEIIVVENNSTEQETFKYYRNITQHYSNVKIVNWEYEFNFSKIINFGAQTANGSYLLLLNNDTVVISEDWIEAMLGICQRNDVGCVGAQLLYEDGTLQHAGVCLVKGAAAAHINLGLPLSNPGYMGLGEKTQNLSAVTAACMLTKKVVFEQVAGFTEDYAVAFNDVDYCLKVKEAGYLVAYTPHAKLFHYESISRGLEYTIEKAIRMQSESFLLQHNWAQYYILGDPYINPNLKQSAETNVYYYQIDEDGLSK